MLKPGLNHILVVPMTNQLLKIMNTLCPRDRLPGDRIHVTCVVHGALAYLVTKTVRLVFVDHEVSVSCELMTT